MKYKDIESERDCLAKQLSELLRKKESEREEGMRESEEKFSKLEKENKELLNYIHKLEKRQVFYAIQNPLVSLETDKN